MKKKELIELIKSLNLNPNDFTVLSSGALVLRGILESANDLDIAVTNEGLNELNQKFDLKEKENSWYKVNEKVECVLDDMDGIKEKIGDYYLQEIHNYLEYLENSSREKDKKRIPLVKKYINQKKI